MWNKCENESKIFYFTYNYFYYDVIIYFAVDSFETVKSVVMSYGKWIKKKKISPIFNDEKPVFTNIVIMLRNDE